MFACGLYLRFIRVVNMMMFDINNDQDIIFHEYSYSGLFGGGLFPGGTQKYRQSILPCSGVVEGECGGAELPHMKIRRSGAPP